VFLPKIGWVKYRDSHPVQGKILEATIKREGEHWFVCLACEVEVPDPAPVVVTENRAVGIDVGLKSFAVLSDGTAIENPRFLGKAFAKLKRAQRGLRRETTRSNRWKKQMAKVVKLHIQVKNARKDFAHKVSTTIVKNHDVIAVEDLHIKGLVKNRHLSRAISDAGWGLLVACSSTRPRGQVSISSRLDASWQPARCARLVARRNPCRRLSARMRVAAAARSWIATGTPV
jgi:putative transposase